MKVIRNHCIEGAAGKPILLDLFWNSTTALSSTVIFCHGYKGFKDWGAWDLVAESFAAAGILFIKFNFSHNGGTVANPIDFPDLEAFGKNNYTIERNDLEKVIDWVTSTNSLLPKSVDKNNLTVIGHSRGGGISLLQAGKDKRIKRVITWAAISDIGNRFPKGEELARWKASGIRHIKNGRTLQEMPHEYQFYEDYLANKNELDILKAVESIDKLLLIHGDQDKAVSIDEALAIHNKNPKSRIEIISNAGHTFGCSHPWSKKKLPPAMEKVVALSIDSIYQHHL